MFLISTSRNRILVKCNKWKQKNWKIKTISDFNNYQNKIENQVVNFDKIVQNIVFIYEIVYKPTTIVIKPVYLDL